MELSQVAKAGRQVIERYGPTGFCVSGVVYRGSVLVFPGATIEWRGEISVDGLAPVVAQDEIELLLLGMGRRMLPVSAALRAAMKARGIAVEAMDTGAACRTFNVLLAEDRRVAAALLLPV